MRSRTLVLVLSIGIVNMIVRASTSESGSDSFKDDKKIEVGRFAYIFYKGNWESTNPNQNNYFSSLKGQILMGFDYDEDLDAKNIRFAFEYFESFYLDEKFMLGNSTFALTGNDQTTFTSKSVGILVKVDKLFSVIGRDYCLMNTIVQLKDSQGKPLNITTNDVRDLILEGSIKGENCTLDFTFKTTHSTIYFSQVLIFLVLAVGFIILGISPLYKALTEGNLNIISNISDTTFLFNIMMDLIIITINMSLGIRIIIDYFEFLTLVTMFLMISILFKIRFYLHLFEVRVSSENYDERTLSRVKFNFLLKFVAACIASVIGANFLIPYYNWFLLLALYPLFQIFHNAFNVIRYHCFHWGLHFALIFPQMFYPLFIKTVPDNFFQLRNDYRFGLVLISLSSLQMIIMILQKKVHPAFFLPKCLIPNYFEYFVKIKELKTEENCPVCFNKLNDNPKTGVEDDILIKNFMETPCKHRFHEICLKSWMEKKLTCPICRKKIPPY